MNRSGAAMRWALAKVAIATTLMVALAFCIPLVLVTHQVAEDRAVTAARESAGSIVTVLAVTDDEVALRRAIAADSSGAKQQLAIHLVSVGSVVGTSHVPAKTIQKLADDTGSVTVEVDGGIAFLRSVLLPNDRVVVVEVFIPDSDLGQGVTVAWLTVTGIAILLVALSVATADRLGGKVVRASRSLADASARLGAGDLSVRVKPAGPKELVDAGEAFNTMADRVVTLLDNERELAADLSHRLRTPLTALKLDSEVLGAGPDADRMRAAVEALETEIDAVIAGARRSVTERTRQHSDVSSVLEDRMSMWGVLAEDHGRSFELTGGGRALWVMIARDDLVSSIDALIGNVFAHTPQDAAFAVDLDVGRAVLTVDDAGPGIDDPEVALARGTSGAGSSGLGLDIVARTARSAGGDVRISRSPLNGARVEWFFGGAVRGAEQPMVGGKTDFRKISIKWKRRVRLTP